MAVLVEAISVIVRRDALDARYAGGSDRYVADCPNATACADAHLVRVGFMDPASVGEHVRALEGHGLVHLDHDHRAHDMVVIDQLHGPTSACEWVDYGHISIDGNTIAAARFAEDQSSQFFTPTGWCYDNSLTKTHRFIPSDEAGRTVKFVREHDGISEYIDLETGKPLFLPTPPSHEPPRRESSP